MKKFKKARQLRKHVPEKKKKLLNKQNIWGLGIILLMVASVIGFQQIKTNEELEQKGFKFTKAGNFWATEVNEIPMQFYTLPNEVENINMSVDAIGRIKGTKMVYLTFDPDQLDLTYVDLVRFDLSDSLPTYFDIFAVSGVIKEGSGYDLPVVTCSNSTPFIPVVYLKEGNNTEVYMEGNCIIAESSSSFNFVRIRDRLVYTLAGILG